MVIIPVNFAQFSDWKNGRCIFEKHYCLESIQFLDIHWCLFFSLHFAADCNNRRRIFRDLNGFRIGWVQVFPAQHVHARAGLQHIFLSSSFIVDGAGKLHSLVGEKKVALSVWLSLNILGQSPRVSAGASLLSCSPLPKTYPQISKSNDCSDEEVLFVFHWAMDLCSLGCSPDAAKLSTRNPTVAHFSQLHF